MTENSNDPKPGEKPVIKGYFYVKDEPVRMALWPAKSGNGYTGSIERKDGSKSYVSAFRDTTKKDGSPAAPNAPLKVYPGGSNDWSNPVMELFPKTAKKNGDSIDKPFLSGKFEGSDIAVNVEVGHELVGLPAAAPADEAEQAQAEQEPASAAPMV